MNDTHKILIVEDDKNSHELFRDVFEKHGFEVVLLENADGFFPEVVNEIKPDIISMDLMIGKNGTAAERDGFEAIGKLKADLRTCDIPIIVLTNFFEESKVAKAKELGAVDYLNLAGQPIQKVPPYYAAYLKDPVHYKPSHPLFRKK